MSDKLWGGRFKGKSDDFLERFTSSIDFDRRLFREDIEGSIAHVKMLGRKKIISSSEAKAIEKGLQEIRNEIEKGDFPFDVAQEDIHMNIERRLLEKVGDAAGKLHTGRSRNDQVATDTRLYLSRACGEIIERIENLQFALSEKGYEYRKVVIPEYTHLQRAQPVLFSHHILAYWEMLERDRERFAQTSERTLVLPLGSAACTGTSFDLDREWVRKKLGFKKLSMNSVDGVSDRDFALEFLFDCSLLMMHLSRFAEEIILWMSSEYRFIDLPDSLCTGSSIMPQKKNPDMAELVRGKTGRVYGDLISLLTVLKGLPLSYNRDLQEDKEPLFDSYDTAMSSLKAAELLVRGMTLREDVIHSALKGGYLTATDLADYLALKGVPFRGAHEVTGNIVRYCLGKGVELEDLTLEELRAHSRVVEEDVFEYISVESSVRRKDLPGGTSPARVASRLRSARRRKKR